VAESESVVWRVKEGRRWRIGGDAEVAWIEENTPSGLAITSAIPAAFEAYATLALPGTGEHDPAPWLDGVDRHEASVMAILSEQTATQPWWLGYLETGASDVVFSDVERVMLYAGWGYVLIEAGPEQAAMWRDDEQWKGRLPDLMFPADRSWLLSTLWDDFWSCLGGSQELVDAFLKDSFLGDRTRVVEVSAEDATPPGHTAT
jgi:hypothetical protein